MKKQSWEPDGELGKHIEYAQAISGEEQDKIDSALGLRTIFIRLHVETIKDLENIAEAKSIVINALIRKILQNFLDNQ